MDADIDMSDRALLDCTGVVLAGGGSRRMGQDKASLQIGGEPLLHRVVARLGSVLPSVLVVGPERLQPLVPGARLVPDRLPDAGPLGGLVSALHAARTPWVFVVGCDMPFVVPALVHAMAELASTPLSESTAVEAVLLRSSNGLEYLHAAYAVTCLPLAEKLLAGGERALHRLVEQLHDREIPSDMVARLDPAGLSVFNANTPAEWERARRLAGTGYA